jgi:hypothetical protein
MNLPVPVPGVDPGPQYATDLNTSLNTIDGHNHTSGNGVAIPVAGLNIQAALSMNNNSLVSTQAVLFQDQPSLATLNALYTVAGELWYNDPTQPVQITAAGSVNASTSGISSGTATASFSAGTLVVNAASLTPADIQGASLLMGLNSAGTNYLTLSPPSSLSGGAYDLVLPAIPSSISFVTLDTSGNLGTAYSISAAQIALGSISAAQIVSGSITGTQLNVNTITAIAPNATSGGKNIVVSNTNTSNQLCIIRGVVGPGGSIVSGEGFSIGNPTTGHYTITFNTPFADVPAVTYACESNFFMTSLSTSTSSGATVNWIDAQTSNFFNNQFSFIAIGQI